MKQLDKDDAKPLGPPLRKEPPPAPAPQWQPVPGRPELERDRQGRLRTNIPGNRPA